MATCMICQTPYKPFLSFGPMPIANGFLTENMFQDEYFFDLAVGFCSHCKMTQLVTQPDRERMFHEQYAFFSSTSMRMARHFQEFAETVIRMYLPDSDAFVIEIGSNDGIMLQHFANANIRHLGIEPSANVAQVAKQKGIQTISEFFDEQLARQIVQQYGQSDAILAANVMCHIPTLHSVAAGIKILLKPNGVLIFEDPYIGDIVEKTSYDQIYDEHAFYFSLASVSYLFAHHGLDVIDVAPQNVHGGSMRYTIAHAGAYPISTSVYELRDKEERLELGATETYRRLCQNIEHSRTKLINLLRELRKQGKRVVGYGATSKSTTVTNYCGMTPDVVEFISDTTPIKQGKYSPGAHIPVLSYQKFSESYPDYALLFAWNHAEEIMAKERKFIESGGKWIVYVPTVQVLA